MLSKVLEQTLVLASISPVFVALWFSGASYDLSEIIEVGRSKFGLSIELDEENGKLVVPSSKREFKKLLRLLNDDLLESPLTQAKYETNSKRRIA